MEKLFRWHSCRDSCDFPTTLMVPKIPQAERQLLLLSQINLIPNISSYAYVYGQHDYNAAPFVPIGMKSLVHKKPNQRKTFAEHCRKGCVLRTSFERYCACIFWMINTRATRVSATVFHNHKYISKPNVTPDESVITAAVNLASALKVTIPACLQHSPLADLTRLSEISQRRQPHHLSI